MGGVVLQIWGICHFWWLDNLRLYIPAMFTDLSFAQDTWLGLHLHDRSLETSPVKKNEENVELVSCHYFSLRKIHSFFLPPRHIDLYPDVFCLVLWLFATVNPTFSSSPYDFVPSLILFPHFIKLCIVFCGFTFPRRKMIGISCFNSWRVSPVSISFTLKA